MPTDMGRCHLDGLGQAAEGPAALVSHRELVLQDSPSKKLHLPQAGHRGWSGWVHSPVPHAPGLHKNSRVRQGGAERGIRNKL